MTAMSRWNDDRFDDHVREVDRRFKDMARQVYLMVPTVEKVSVLDERMDNLNDGLHRLEKVIEDTIEDIKELTRKPIQETKERITLLMATIIGAMTSGAITLIVTIIAKGKVL